MYKTDPITSVFFHYDGKEAHSNIWSSGEKLAEFCWIPLSLQSRNTKLSFFMVCGDLLSMSVSLLCILAFGLSLKSVFLLLISYISSFWVPPPENEAA